MAVEGINISLGEVTKTAGTIRTLNTSLSTQLENIRTEMNNLSSTWQSDSSETIRSKFNTMANQQFETYKKIIEAYAKFLDNTVTTYDTVETAINNNASAFK